MDTDTDTDTDIPADTDASGETGLVDPPSTDSGTEPEGFPTGETWTRPCAETTYTYDGVADSLAAVATGPGSVIVELHGRTHGCGCQGSLRAVPDESTREIAVWLAAGQCDAIYCCNVMADVTDVPAGDWTFFRPQFQDGLATSVTVP